MSKTCFECPYSGHYLTRSCEVESCNFNLAETPLAKTYQRCFLNYLEHNANNPHQLDFLEESTYPQLPIKQREQVLRAFFDLGEDEVRQAKALFYQALFTIMTNDLMHLVPRERLEPVPFEQCAVCGGTEGELWYPRSLPRGYGYCSYACYQLKPPPLLLLEQSLEVSYEQLLKHFDFQNVRSRPKFTKQIIRWVLGEIPMR